MAVWDEASTTQSREFIQRFSLRTIISDLVTMIQSAAEMEDLINRNKITMALHIPWDFSKKLDAGQKTSVQLILDGTDSNAALITSRYASTIIFDYAVEILNSG